MMIAGEWTVAGSCPCFRPARSSAAFTAEVAYPRVKSFTHPFPSVLPRTQRTRASGLASNHSSRGPVSPGCAASTTATTACGVRESSPVRARFGISAVVSALAEVPRAYHASPFSGARPGPAPAAELRAKFPRDAIKFRNLARGPRATTRGAACRGGCPGRSRGTAPALVTPLRCARALAHAKGRRELSARESSTPFRPGAFFSRPISDLVGGWRPSRRRP